VLDVPFAHPIHVLTLLFKMLIACWMVSSQAICRNRRNTCSDPPASFGVGSPSRHFTPTNTLLHIEPPDIYRKMLSRRMVSLMRYM
jgi:hypothetical protein